MKVVHLGVSILTLGSLYNAFATATTPSPARYFKDQIVDHSCDCDDKRRWAQRYYERAKEFRGPGHPIICILGGEGNIEPSTGLLYPFITHHLAKDFGAYVIQPEHRFYGESQPIINMAATVFHNNTDTSSRNNTLLQLFTPDQALQDAMRLIRHFQNKMKCSLHRTSPLYCPVITVGGSYPGWLSAMARLRFSDIVDMAYAASAPMLFYSQQVQPELYYQRITAVADQTYPDCATNVKRTLDMVQYILKELSNEDIDDMVVSLGFCPQSQPKYIRSMSILAEELFMIVGYTFANDNMANYPPSSLETGQTTSLYKSCETFASIHWDPIEIVAQFIRQHLLSGAHSSTTTTKTDDCVDMSLQLPTGNNATLSSGDWSGVGTGLSGERWDFQTCTYLVEAIGFYSDTTMFPERPWSPEWLQQHCYARFQVQPQPNTLVEEWHFDDLVGSTNASHILFTNGLKDGWSVGGILNNLSDTLLSINFENGAHHSDLSGLGPTERDTPDIVEGFITIRAILTTWLNEIQPGKYPIQLPIVAVNEASNS